MIEISGLVKQYGPTIALAGVSASFPGGQVVGLMGPNGAGKSTLLRAIVGLIRPTSGEIAINGVSMDREPQEAKQHLGYVPEVSNAYDALTSLEFLDFVGGLRGLPYDVIAERAKKWLRELLVADVANVQLRHQSKGQRQKTMVASALLHRPTFLLCDEPFDGLDVESAHALRNVLIQHAVAGGSVIFATHDVEIVATICTRVLALKSGAVVLDHGLSGALSGQASMEIADMYRRAVA